MAEEEVQDIFGSHLSQNHLYLLQGEFHYETNYNVPSYGFQLQVRVNLNFCAKMCRRTELKIEITDEKQPDIQYTQLASPPISNTNDIGSTSYYSSASRQSPTSQNGNISSPDHYSLDLDFNHTIEYKDLSNKRRQQNRKSQIAHRQRNKKLIEDLRQEVTEYSEYNQYMYQTLQDLRETTKALVSTIDQALSMQPPTHIELTKAPRASRYSDGGKAISGPR
jgi:hypothetical protein